MNNVVSISEKRKKDFKKFISDNKVNIKNRYIAVITLLFTTHNLFS